MAIQTAMGKGDTAPATHFMQLLQVKAARDLALDMRIKR